MERIITKSFARLMGRGTHRGFITHEELNKSLGKRNLSDQNLAQALIHILDEGVVLVEKNYTILKVHVPLSRILKNNFVRCPYKDFFGHRFWKKGKVIQFQIP